MLTECIYLLPVVLSAAHPHPSLNEPTNQQERVLQLETQLRTRDAEVQEALAAASAAGGRDKQVRVFV